MVKKGKRRRWRGKERPKGRYEEMDISAYRHSPDGTMTQRDGEKQTGTRGRQRDRDLAASCDASPFGARQAKRGVIAAENDESEKQVLLM